MVPVPVGARRRRAVPRRGRRRAPHAQRRVGELPLGPDHVRAEPARRRRRLPAHDGRHLGPRRPRGGAARVPRAGGAGHPLGLRREPPRQPHGHAPAAARVLRRVPRARDRLRPAAAHGRGAAASGSSASRTASSPRPRAWCSPTTSCSRRSAAATRSSARCSTSGRASPRSSCTRRSTATSCGPRTPTGRVGSRTTRSCATTRRSPDLIDRAGATLDRLPRAARPPAPAVSQARRRRRRRRRGAAATSSQWATTSSPRPVGRVHTAAELGSAARRDRVPTSWSRSTRRQRGRRRANDASANAN